MTIGTIQIIGFSIIFSVACKKSMEQSPATRMYRMGFQNSAPRPDFNLYIQSLQLWTTRADAAMITTEVPWDSLYSGMTAETFVFNNYKGLVDYYRQQHFPVWVFIDPGNGLDRTMDAAALVKRNKSIAQPDVQLIYRRFCFVMDSIIKPDHLGLALETNLIRAASPDSVYQGIKKSANDAAIQIRAFNPSVLLSISIQVETVWGKSSNNIFQGVAQDMNDFPFIRELGLSSYPYFSFDQPGDIPVDYYSRIKTGSNLPVFVSEGGWSSRTVGTFAGSTQKQYDYINRQGQLLDNAQATALFQLVFTDIDPSYLPPGISGNIGYFTSIGLVDINLNPKPALKPWDLLFKRFLVQ